MIKIGIIGSSKIADTMVEGLEMSGRFEIFSNYSRTQAKGKEFAAKHNIKNTYTTLAEFANSGITAVYIASPNSLHEEQTRFFLERKINVLCEKPCVCNPEEYKSLKALADNNGVIYIEAIMSQFAPARDALKCAIKDIGRISTVRLDYSQRSSRYDAQMNGIEQNIFSTSLKAGCLNDLGVYAVYCALDLFGVPEKISSKAFFLDNGADLYGYSVFDYDNFSALISYSKAGQSYSGSEIVGDNGTIKIEMLSRYIGVSLIKNGVESKLSGLPEHAESMSYETAKFADLIENKEENKNYYETLSSLTYDVHTVMSKIRESAGIKYKN